MSNKSISVLFLILLLIPLFNAEILSKNEVLNMEVEDCDSDSEDSDCKSYSNGCVDERCSYNFYCVGENCISVKDSDTSVQFTTAEGNNEKLITRVCNNGNNGFCTTEKCTTNSNCLSNNCNNGVCLVNQESPVIQCRSVRIYKNYLSFRKSKTFISCGRTTNEYCEKDDDCTTKNCGDNNLCMADFNTNYWPSIIISIATGVVILIIILIALFCIIKRRRSRYYYDDDE